MAVPGAVVNNTPNFQSIKMSNFKSLVDREITQCELLKDNQTTAANNMPELEARISNVINTNASTYPNLAANWRYGTPFPAMTLDPLPGIVAPTAQEERTIAQYERVNNAEMFEREMHNLLVQAIHAAATPLALYHRSMEIDQPNLEVPYTPAQLAAHNAALVTYNVAVAAHPAAIALAAALVPPGPVPLFPIAPVLPPRIVLPARKGIYGQNLREAWALLCTRIGKPVSVNVNQLELSLKMETQPADIDLMTWFATFIEKIEVLRELGRGYENPGRPCEAADIFINTIVDARYKDFKREYLVAHYSDDLRSLATLANWITTRAWASEQDMGAAQHRGLSAEDNDADHENAGTAAASRTPAGRRAPPMAKAHGRTKEPAITTMVDVTSFNKVTLKQMGLKLVPIDQPRKPTPPTAAAAGRRPSPPPNNQGGRKEKVYCWTHGSFPQGKGHASAQCNFPKDGHQDAATSSNKMGGSKADYQPR